MGWGKMTSLSLGVRDGAGDSSEAGLCRLSVSKAVAGRGVPGPVAA